MRVGIVGATGAVGREMIFDLEQSGIDNLEVSAYASSRSAGSSFTFRGQQSLVEEFSPEKLQGTQVVLMSAGGGFSKQFSQQLADQGALVIDNSSAWRMDPKVLLIVPEVNGHLLKGLDKGKGGIIANPNCSTIQMVVALKAFESYGLREVDVATYQSVSGSGQKGIKELQTQVKSGREAGPFAPEFYQQPIAFNVLPAIDRMVDGGHCFEEVKMIEETRKIMGLPKLSVFATTARVPTYHCHCEAVTVTLEKEIDRNEAISQLGKIPGLKVDTKDKHGEFPTPLGVTGDQGVFVSRIRLPYGESRSHRLQFWIVADNLKKGAATNAVQIFKQIVSAS